MSVEAEKRIGRIANAGWTHTAAVFQQQTAFANSPIAENRERTRSTCRQCLLQGLAERLNVVATANKLVRSDWEIGLRTHVGPPKSQERRLSAYVCDFRDFCDFWRAAR